MATKKVYYIDPERGVKRFRDTDRERWERERIQKKMGRSSDEKRERSERKLRKRDRKEGRESVESAGRGEWSIWLLG